MRIELGEGSACVSVKTGFRLRKALGLLFDSASYADDLGRGPWDFAVTIRELRAAVLSDNDLRWLVYKGHMEHAIEITEAGEEVRSFRPSGGVVFSDRACFVLTERGRVFALTVRSEGTDWVAPWNGHALAAPPTADGPPVVAAVEVPTWDRDRQELRWGDRVVKQFKVPSPNQETILAAFEEEHWPPRIDDPLSPQFDQDPKRRLHDTINTLNRNQKSPLIRFLGDGSGQGVRWEPVGRDAGQNGELPRGAAASNGLPVEPTDV